MKNTSKKSSFAQKVDLGVRRGVARALAEHKKAGRSIHVWQDGKIVEIPAKKIKIDKQLLDEKR
ncbi:MAG: hypothetical protein A3F17_05315 [Gammaproteobacteria bacterium RIFCSPHIGHO2_12_FULL_41_15]|nr:MAG: hypothetical protein A3F17_05315 [Gammaproteobacteria bacterium RIFCSPHIGHO2_12_FULL_41_15]